MLTWIKNATGYVATGDYGTVYEVCREGKKFFLMMDGNIVTLDPGTLKYCKEAAEEQEMNRKAAEKAKQKAPAPVSVVDYEPDPMIRKINRVIELRDNAIRAGHSPEAIANLMSIRYDIPDTAPSSPVVLPPEKPAGLLTMLAQREREQQQGEQTPHMMVIARAGTGKTTTLVGGMQVIRGQQPADAAGRPLQPTPQQQAIWDAMDTGPRPRSVGFVAFNKTIAKELRRRVPSGCDAMTMHSMGFKAVRNAFTLLPDDRAVNKWRVNDILCESMGVDPRILAKQEPTFGPAVERVVALCKQNLVDGDDRESIRELIDHYDVECGADLSRILDFVPRILERCLNVAHDGCIDYNDQIWLPVVLNLPMFTYDLLLVDEFQDLNRCQQELVRRAGRRLVCCGDPKQAIYGFAGAMSDSMAQMEKFLKTTQRGVETYYLTVTHRCGKEIVKEAQRIVPDFTAADHNPPGVVRNAPYSEVSKNPSGNYWLGGDTARRQMERRMGHTYLDELENGDMVVSRVVAPLTSECFKLIAMGKKATIQGRDIGAGLIKFINSLKAGTIVELMQKADEWCNKETILEQAKKRPSERKIMELNDKADCVRALCQGKASVFDVTKAIDKIFGDQQCPSCKAMYSNEWDYCRSHACNRAVLVRPAGIRLSSIHKAKGLEARRVYFIRTEDSPCPHPMAKTAREQEQEMNLLYVALTRAIQELVYVS